MAGKPNPLSNSVYLTVSRHIRGPVTVAGERVSRRPPPPRTSARPARWWMVTVAWALLVGAVIACLASDGEFGMHDWAVSALVCMAGWPICHTISWAANDERSDDEAGESDDQALGRGPSPECPTTVVLREGAMVTPALVRILAGFLGIPFIEPPAD